MVVLALLFGDAVKRSRKGSSLSPSQTRAQTRTHKQMQTQEKKNGGKKCTQQEKEVFLKMIFPSCKCALVISLSPFFFCVHAPPQGSEGPYT